MGDKFYKNKAGIVIKVSEFSDGNGTKIDLYDKDPRDPDHKSVHLKVDKEKNFEMNDTLNGEKEDTTGGCYLTTACINHFNDKFDDNCYELDLLRWFRDNFVSEEDVEYYYQVAPTIVQAINENDYCDDIYKEIYNNIIVVCVKAIEDRNYDLTYSIYKNSILELEEKYARPMVRANVVKVLKKNFSY